MTFEGRIEARNDTGIKLNGEWLNRSRFGPRVELPEVGDQVHVEVDGKGFLKTWWRLLDEEPTAGASRDERIARLTVLKAAAHFAAARTELKSADVLRIADSWLDWVEQ